MHINTHGLFLVTLVVREYEEALAFFVGILGFHVIEDTPVPEQGKRWVVIAPPGRAGPLGGARLLLARASTPEQQQAVGAQTGGRVGFFLSTDNIERDHAAWHAAGVEFVRPLLQQPYGRVTVFKDLYGNLWDLVQPAPGGD
jgi:catechol 2,3-dioxygenase-like lactoylglutathione lyase family enzyme